MKNYKGQDPNDLYQKLKKNILENKKTVLDFSEVINIERKFLEDSLGKLMQEFSFEKVQHRINFTNINKTHKILIQELIKAYK